MRRQDIHLYKHAQNGLMAHIYEHVVANWLDSQLHNAGLFFVVDYSLWAHTYGTTCLLAIRPVSVAANRKIRRALREFHSSELTDAEIRRAAEECGLEYRRPLIKIESVFFDTIRALHAKEWGAYDELAAAQATVQSSVDTVFDARGIAYDDEVEGDVREVVLHFEVPQDNYRNDPARKALAVLLVQALSLNILREICETYAAYDDGDEWNEGARTVAYRNYLLVADDVSEKDVEAFLVKRVGELACDTGFIQSFRVLLARKNLREADQYFSLEAMNRITDGILIGPAGWRSVADEATIRELLSAVTVKVVK